MILDALARSQTQRLVSETFCSLIKPSPLHGSELTSTRIFDAHHEDVISGFATASIALTLFVYTEMLGDCISGTGNSFNLSRSECIQFRSKRYFPITIVNVE